MDHKYNLKANKLRLNKFSKKHKWNSAIALTTRQKEQHKNRNSVKTIGRKINIEYNSIVHNNMGVIRDKIDEREYMNNENMNDKILFFRYL